MKSPEQFGRKKPTIEEVLARLRDHKDEAVRAIVENIFAIQEAQSAGEGTVEDRQRMKQLEETLNERFKELGEAPVSLG